MMGKAGITRIGNGPFGNMQALLDFYENYPTFPAPKVSNLCYELSNLLHTQMLKFSFIVLIIFLIFNGIIDDFRYKIDSIC